MKKANKILEDAGITVNEQKLSKDEIDFIASEVAGETAFMFNKYSQKKLLKDMKNSVEDDSFDSSEAQSIIKTLSKKMHAYIKKFKG